MQQMNRVRLFLVACFVLPLSVILSSFVLPVNYSSHLRNTSGKDTPGVAESRFSHPTLMSFAESKMEVYDSLGLESFGLSRKVFEMGLHGMEKLKEKGAIKNNILTIADLSQASVQKRLYVIDLDNYELLYNTWVAHGRNSGTLLAQSFSNSPRSRKTSLGFYVTEGTYEGNNGYSLKLKGMESGFNSNAFRRAIVVHGADYVNERYIESQGYIGRSFGCPAVPADISSEIIDHIKDGTCLFIFAPYHNYLQKSSLLH